MISDLFSLARSFIQAEKFKEYKSYCTNQQIASIFLVDAKKNDTFMRFIEVPLVTIRINSLI